MSELEEEIKLLIINTLDLEDVSVTDIVSDQELFGEGLGLDSIDALELGLALQKNYGIKVDADADDTRNNFESVTNLAIYVAENRAD